MPSISLLKKVNVDGEWKFAPVPRNKTSWATDKVMLNGKPVKAPDGMFYLQWREKGKRLRKSVGPNARTAVNRWKLKQWDVDEAPTLTIRDRGHRLLLTGSSVVSLQGVRCSNSPSNIR